MKVKIFLVNIFFSLAAYSQAAIEINPSSCSGSSGLIEIISGTFYEGYQWYSRPINSSAAFLPIPDAIEESFVFDWATYNNMEIVVWCITFNDFPQFSYFSNTLEIDSQDCNLSVNDESSNSLRLNTFLDSKSSILYLVGQDEIDDIEIFNLTGEKILTAKPSGYKFQIDISYFPSGIYILSVSSENESKIVKFVKS